MRTVIISAFLLSVLFGMAVFPTTGKALTITPKMEISADPGQTVSGVIKLTNEERESRTLYLRYENFQSLDESGTPSFISSRSGLATWINTVDSITMGPLEHSELPFTITIPRDADPGGHFAAIFLQREPPRQDGGQLGIGAKLGTLILLRVSGDFVQDANILEFGTVNKQRFFTSLPVHFYYRFQNTGDDFVKPLGGIDIKNIFGGTAKILLANTVDGSVLPKSIRRFETVWANSGKPRKQEVVTELPSQPSGYWEAAKYQLQNFAFGKYTAKLELVFGTLEQKTDTAKFTFFVFPWQLLSIAIPGIILVLLILWFIIRRYNRYIVSKARRSDTRPYKK